MTSASVTTGRQSTRAGDKQRRRAARRERLRVTIRSVGEGFITMGVVVLLFCTYQLFWTNVSADNKTNQVIAQVEQSFTVPAVPGTAPVQPITIQDGQGYGLMYIPRLGSDWVKPLVEGESLANLKKGITHYKGNAQPGEIGNFAAAGHRATNGEPFRNLDRMQRGDRVYVQTAREWVIYEVDRTLITKPNATWVLLPVPGRAGQSPTQALMTLTTCNPRWASYQRLIVFGKLVQKYPRELGAPKEIRAVA